MKNLRFVFLAVAAFMAAPFAIFAQVSINTDGTAPHTSAMLEVKSTNKGLLIPRMTTAQRTTLGVSATAGLMVYDTDLNKFYYHNGSGWVEGSVGGYWTRTGTNLYNTNTGDKVGIGTATPGKTLEVFGGGSSRPLRLNSSTLGVGLELMSTDATDWGIMTWGNNLRFVTSTDNFSSAADEYFFDQNEFTPWTNNTKTVGSSVKRFNKLYFVEGDFSGNVGIGTTTPGYIAGSSRYLTVSAPETSGIQTASLELKGNTGTTFSPVGKIDFLSRGGTGTIYNIGRIESSITTAQFEGELLFYTNGGTLTEKMRIDEDGNVGIGTTSPLTKLHVADGNNGAIRIGSHGNWYGELSYTYLIGDLVIQSGNASTATGADIIFRTYGKNRAIFNGSGNVGIGTLTPLAKLHVHDSTLSNTTFLITPSTTVSGDSSKIFMGEDAIGYYGMYWLYDGSSNNMQLFGKAGSSIYGPHFAVNRNTGNAAFGNTFATGYKLSVSGKIICEELRVNLVASWPDYVFKKDYELLPIEQLGSYVEENGHLPNVPAAAEIEKTGLDVGNMQKIMMEKIEELSLYIIDQQKQIKELKDQVNELKNK